MKKPTKNFLMTLCAIATLLVVAFLRHYIIFSLVLLFLISFSMIKLDGNKNAIWLFLAVFFLGPLTEIFAIHFGAWTYQSPMILGVPLYLAFVWGNAGLFIRNLDLRITR